LQRSAIMPTVLITGANRGLGLEFTRQYSSEGWEVVATARQSSAELEALDVRTEQLDMADLPSVSRFGERLDHLDLFIANAGTYGPRDAADAEEAQDWLDTFAVNTVAPYLLAHSLLSLVSRSGGKLVAVSSRMGSIADNSSGGYLAYRTSKTALNSAWRNLALEGKPMGVIAAVLHPGWVKTRMGGESAPISPERSVAGMRQVIDRLKTEVSGEFFGYDGTTIPW
jgi:NAD(P)-dependent dehydrogenase (short-subunit alcohol dehydrogenase family)